jgi:hypothetical protein
MFDRVTAAGPMNNAAECNCDARSCRGLGALIAVCVREAIQKRQHPIPLLGRSARHFPD